MKDKAYETPEMELVRIEGPDVITSSPGGNHAGDPDCLVDF